MIEVDKSVCVARPPQEVFRYIADFANMPEWDPGVGAARKVTDGPVGVGTCYHLEVAFGGRSVPMEYKVLRWEPDQRVVLEGYGKGVTARDDVRFVADGAGTGVNWHASLHLHDVPALGEAAIRPVFEYYGRRTMQHLAEAFVPREAPRRRLTQVISDRLVVPGMIGFTRLGYSAQRRNWSPITADLSGRTCVVTGATSGLGLATAERLAAMGGDVVLVGRNAQKLDAAIDEIHRRTGSERLHAQQADLSRMEEVAALAGRLQQLPALHVLVNNAGVLLNQRTTTDEGFETSFATNLLGHVLLTELLLEKLRDQAPARIVNVSSGGMYTQRVRTGDLQSARGRWDGAVAYARAKRAQLIYSEQLAQRLEGSGVVVNAMHPGWADTPGVEGSLPLFHKLTAPLLRSPEEGADTIVWLAAAHEAAHVSGKFWLDRQPRETYIFPHTRETSAERIALWNELHAMLGPWLGKDDPRRKAG